MVERKYEDPKNPVQKFKAVDKSKSNFTPGGGGVFDFNNSNQKDKERAEFFKNSVLVCVVNGHLLFFREKWYNWNLNFEANTCNGAFKRFSKKLIEFPSTIGDPNQQDIA